MADELARRETGQREFAGHVRDFLIYEADVRNLSPNTVRGYRVDLEAYEAWAEREGVDPMHVEHRDVRAWLAELTAAGYASTTVNRHLSSVRSVYAWMLSRGVTVEDAAEAVASPKLGRRLPKTVADEGVHRLLAACGDDAVGVRDKTMVELLYATGARISEASGLDVRDVDLDLRQARLFGKGSKERIVPLYDRACSQVAHYLSEARPLLLARSKTPAQTPALFVSSRGGRMSADALRGRFERLAADNGAFGTYVHANGKVGTVVEFSFSKPETAEAESFKTFAHDCAMQAAAIPGTISARREDVPADVVEHELSIYKAQAAESGKPEAIQEKIAQGRLNKFFAESVLSEQAFIKDGDITIRQYAEKVGKELGDKIEVVAFKRITFGE